MSAAAAPEEKGDGVEAMEVTEAVSHRRQRAVSRRGQADACPRRDWISWSGAERGVFNDTNSPEGNICEIHTCSQFHAVSSHVTVTRPENR